jgi:hypothetical protein
MSDKQFRLNDDRFLDLGMSNVNTDGWLPNLDISDNLSFIIGLCQEIEAREKLIACLETRKKLLERKSQILDALGSK